jgi:hypothetical protein
MMIVLKVKTKMNREREAINTLGKKYKQSFHHC